MSKMFIKIMNWIMLSCRKATELIEKQKVLGLSNTEKMQLKMHVGVCKACEKYQTESDELDRHLKNIFIHQNETTSSENLKHTILKKIKAEQ